MTRHRSPPRSSRAEQRRAASANDSRVGASAAISCALTPGKSSCALARRIDSEHDGDGRRRRAPRRTARASSRVRENRCGWKTATTRAGSATARRRSSPHLGRVVGVVVDDARAGRRRSELLEAPLGADEAAEASRQRRRSAPASSACAQRRRGVAAVMLARDAQRRGSRAAVEREHLDAVRERQQLRAIPDHGARAARQERAERIVELRARARRCGDGRARRSSRRRSSGASARNERSDSSASATSHSPSPQPALEPRSRTSPPMIQAGSSPRRAARRRSSPPSWSCRARPRPRSRGASRRSRRTARRAAGRAARARARRPARGCRARSRSSARPRRRRPAGRSSARWPTIVRMPGLLQQPLRIGRPCAVGAGDLRAERVRGQRVGAHAAPPSPIRCSRRSASAARDDAVG